MLVQSSLQVVCHAGVQDSISFVGQKVDIILFHALTAFLGVEFAEAFLLSERVLRDCHVASLLAMTNRRCVPFLRWLVPNGSAFPRLPRRFAPRNDKSGGQHRFNGGRYGLGVPSRDCHVGLRPPRNDKSGGQHRFNGGQYGSGVPSRDCHVGLRPPRNDKSEVRTVFTMARTERQYLLEIATSLRSSQ